MLEQCFFFCIGAVDSARGLERCSLSDHLAQLCFSGKVVFSDFSSTRISIGVDEAIFGKMFGKQLLAVDKKREISTIPLALIFFSFLPSFFHLSC